MDDYQLIKEIKNGNVRAFEDLLLKYHKAICRFIYNMVKDNEVTKDISQEVFVSAYNNIYKFREDGKFSIWLYKIAKNKVIDYYRKTNNTAIISDEIFSIIPSKEETVEEKIEFKERKKSIEKYIDSLSLINRKILYLKYYNEELTFKDISIILELSESAVKNRYYQLHKRYLQYENNIYERGDKNEM